MRFRLPIILPVLAFATVAVAHSGVKDPTVMARMNGMTDLGRASKTLGEMMQGKTAFDAGAAQAAAAELATQAALIPDRFRDPATDPKSEALPIIWEQFDDFLAIAARMKVAAESAQGITTLDDLNAAFAAIGQTCRDCHRTYRKP